ncbi:MAG: hypothetical protein U0Y68_09690 [Blastocatellia bacterium]
MTNEENIVEEKVPSDSGLQGLLESPRFIPFVIAVLVCLLIAVISAYALWFFLGRPAPPQEETNAVKVITPSPAPTIPVASPRPLAPAGELAVAEGVMTIGGEEYCKTSFNS